MATIMESLNEFAHSHSRAILSAARQITEGRGLLVKRKTKYGDTVT